MQEQISNRTKKTTPLTIFLRILMGLIIFACIFFLGVRLYFRLPVRDYYKASEKGFLIPDIHNGFIAQGISLDDGIFYVTGYMKDGSASPLYLIDEQTGQLQKTIYMDNIDGKPFTGHCGGVSAYGKYVYIAGHCDLKVLTKTDIQNASDASHVAFVGEFPLGGVTAAESIGAAFTTIDHQQIIVGEFYRNPNYPTDVYHKLTTPSGDYNQALAIVYNLSEGDNSCFGIEKTPVELLSIPDQIQGITVNDGKYYLSQSYGVPNSHIYEYDKSKCHTGTLSFMGKDMPITYLGSASLLHDYEIAPMSEEIQAVDNRFYVMCESASNKYIFGKFTSAKWCYVTDFEKMK